MSRISADIDVQVQSFLSGPLHASGYAYLYLDAIYLHIRLARAMQVCSSAVVLSMGMNELAGWSCSASRSATTNLRRSRASLLARSMSAASQESSSSAAMPTLASLMRFG